MGKCRLCTRSSCLPYSIGMIAATYTKEVLLLLLVLSLLLPSPACYLLLINMLQLSQTVLTPLLGPTG